MAQEKPAAEKRQAAGKKTAAYPPVLPGAQVEVYKTIGDVKLNAYLFAPSGHQPEDRRPAIVFFFGGGWRAGSPGQFQQQCQYLASRGMVAIAADYRVANRHGTKAVDCVRDAKSAIRWVRQQATRLGVDPARIVAAGGSAGGHIAACSGVLEAFDETGEDAAISSRPNALVLFNPALLLGAMEGQPGADRAAELRDRMGVEPKELSPYHHVRSGAPPTIIFHGKNDTTVPYRTAEAFTEAMKKAGNRCELVGYDGQGHGFFNYGRAENEYYRRTVRAMDEFLASVGYLAGKPSIAE
jgi:acetyl esterase/lipase